MKRTCSIIRSLSSALSPSPVAPWPQLRSPFDQWLAAELDGLRYRPTATWLARALDVAIAAQKSAARTVRSACAGSLRGKDLDHYLDVTVELLDACAAARRRMDKVRAYVDSLNIAVHRLEGASDAAVRRACAELDSCAATDLGRCGSGLRKVGERIAARERRTVMYSDVEEALDGSQSVAVLFVAMVGAAASVGAVAVCGGNKSAWTNSLSEIRKAAKGEFVLVAETVAAVRRLRRSMTSANARREAVGELRRRCGELEENLRPLEERVGVLYRELIDVRMALLGMIPRA